MSGSCISRLARWNLDEANAATSKGTLFAMGVGSATNKRMPLPLADYCSVTGEAPLAQAERGTSRLFWTRKHAWRQLSRRSEQRNWRTERRGSTVDTFGSSRKGRTNSPSTTGTASIPDGGGAERCGWRTHCARWARTRSPWLRLRKRRRQWGRAQ